MIQLLKIVGELKKNKQIIKATFVFEVGATDKENGWLKVTLQDFEKVRPKPDTTEINSYLNHNQN